MTLAGANRNADFSGGEQLAHRTNYFKGNNPAKWQTEIPNYREVRIDNIYDGIDMVWRNADAPSSPHEGGVAGFSSPPGLRRGADASSAGWSADGVVLGGLQYDFIVAPGADASRIEWRIEGAENVSIDAGGDLVIETEAGTLRQRKPFSYQSADGNSSGQLAVGSGQEKQEIKSGFVVTQKQRTTNHEQRTFSVKFILGDYDRSKPLVIDPVNLSNLSFSTFLGGISNDVSTAMAVDNAGNIFVTGETPSPLFPTTPGAFDTTSNGSVDVFVTKLTAAGKSLVYSTFIGGAFGDTGYDIAVDAAGNAFIVGLVSSPTYPTTAGAYDTTYNFSGDVAVTKLNPTGSTLVYSTFIGGNGLDISYGLAIDSSGSAYLTGFTFDAGINYPTTAGAFDITHNGSTDVFVTKLNVTGTALDYSTFIGGGNSDEGRDIAIDSSGSAYLTGYTVDAVTDYPTTAGAFDTTHNGSEDVFVTKLNSSGSALVFSTFIGGSSDDEGHGIAIDSSGSAYLTGYTLDAVTDYPTTAGAFDTTHNGGFDLFVTKLNPVGAVLDYSTFIGGSSSDFGLQIAIDLSGSAYLAGYSNDAAIDYPTTAGAFDTVHNGGFDVIMTKLNLTGTALVYSTFIGGTGTDIGDGLAIDSSGNTYLTGYSADDVTNFPTTPEVFQPLHNGSNDVFVSKFGDWSITGRTVDQAGLPLANTLVTMSGSRGGFMLTDAAGFFGFTDTIAGSGTNYTIAATRSSTVFNPPNYQITNLAANQEVYFGGRPGTGPSSAPAELGGDVRSIVGNVPLPNTTIILNDPVEPQNSRTVMTDSGGNYLFENLPTGRYYVVYAFRDGFSFNPGYHGVTFLQENLNLDFAASPTNLRPVQDFDGDGKTDLVVFRPSNGVWYMLRSQDNSFAAVHFGTSGDIPVSEDYDGDNRADVAVYRPSEGNWYVLQSTAGFKAVRFGAAEDRTAPADFDGDGSSDISVFRPSTGVWHRLNSSDGSYNAAAFGQNGDIPVTGYFDSDARSEISVYRPSNGTWYRLNSTDGSFAAVQFGTSEDIPTGSDFDGDGRTDIAVFRPSNGAWYWLDSIDGEFHAIAFGASSDIPVAADYNGDGRYEHAVFRSGIWYVLRTDSSSYGVHFGQSGDIPAP